MNTKVARVVAGTVVAALGRPFELQRDPGALVPLLRELASDVGANASDAHAVTMTAELSQMFRTKREGVSFVLDAIETAFPSSAIGVYTVDGRFLSPSAARDEPLAVAAANWAATARAVARLHPDALLIDVGTTSTDIIPIVGGAIVAVGHTDPARLVSGELVYTGALRTPVEAMATYVPYGDGAAGLSAEGFALAGDVHVWRGDLAASDYTCPTPDGRPATREYAGERLARAICADRDMVGEAGVSAIANALAREQVTSIAASIRRVLALHPSLTTAVVTGLGAFIGDAAARAAGLHVVSLGTELGDAAARCAPAAAVALLFDTLAPTGSAPSLNTTHRGTEALRAERNDGLSASVRCVVDVVVKLGGGVLVDPTCFDAAVAAIGLAARERALLVVPGGGPFADAVRDVDGRLGLSNETAHWMAVLAMDQYAHVIASRLPGAVLVADPNEIAAALRAGSVPVLAPSRWLRDADPLPHSWDVTSDSIAAWVAGRLGARRLVLVKPPGLRVQVDPRATAAGTASPHAAVSGLVDRYFARVLPATVTTLMIPADQVDTLSSALRAGPFNVR